MKSGTPAAEMSRASSMVRFAAIGVVVAGIASLFADAGGWLAPHRLTPKSMINTFEAVNGPHPGFRRNHAKGVCVPVFSVNTAQGFYDQLIASALDPATGKPDPDKMEGFRPRASGPSMTLSG